MAAAGRPTTLTEEVLGQIEILMPKSYFVEWVYNYLRIPKATFYSWIARGRAEQVRLFKNPKAKPKASEDIYLRLLDTVKRDQAGVLIKAFDSVQMASSIQWQAGAWLTERLAPDKCGLDRGLLKQLMAEVADLKKRLGDEPPVAPAPPASAATPIPSGDGVADDGRAGQTGDDGGRAPRPADPSP